MAKIRRSFKGEDSFEGRERRRKNYERQRSKEMMDFAAEELGKVIRQIKRDRTYR